MRNPNVDGVVKVDWPVSQNIQAFFTLRQGGTSSKPFESFNLANHVGDDTGDVAKNRQLLREKVNLPSSPLWLDQVHGTSIVDLSGQKNRKDSIIRADASFATSPDTICAILTADCLPILMASKTTNWVSAIHAGWRGLADGIITNSINAYTKYGERHLATDLVAWLGPAIGKTHFEVGIEVKNCFMSNRRICACDIKHAFAEVGNGKYLCDLYFIARKVLESYNIDVYGGNYCTYIEKSKFYSFRRDGGTGRMATMIWFGYH